MILPRCLLALAMVVGSMGAANASPWVAGLHHMMLTDPVDSRPMQALAFYPAKGHARASHIDGYALEVAEEVPVAQGRFPLLVLSHGNTGSPLALLARRNGWAGLIIHGNVRDVGPLKNIPLGIVARGAWPVRSDNRAGGRRDVPLLIDTVGIEPGQRVCADEDGIVVMHRL